ncbi:zinc finger CCCH domain-containing protein 39 isoform X2 [Sorghum bicolor]|uniref:zinc finger CCCH domain-containing protein 39 isoform X2 n=1 Tax=Sorghum bicolor TaxID=4558 RepID=UPI000B423A03|nr:zinc finger CCCH domain-containing protein 39 isoform X2 [Sorghum bicolor]|eukprot:XP_021302927.1 zinc finger CCCH domain-containing protein 39 isoform X2 [Sorghum bicolor]
MEVVAPAQHDALHAAFGPKPFGGIGGDGRFSSSLSSLGGDRFFGYSTTTASSCFGNSPGLSSPSPRAASLSRGSSESGSVVDDGDDAADAATVAERRLRLARLALQYQEVVNRFELCLSYLADASNEAAALRRENDELRVANEDLARRIEVVGCKLVDEFSSLRLAEEHATPPPPPPPPPSPLPVAPVMPKSISIRSPGYLKMNQNGKHRASKPTKQRVFVGMDGGVKGEEERKGVEEKKLNGGLEFEVYNQGMLKTELCNKWEETGACPYGDQCQFAHGIGELRPVIRHPRYKTQVCRMVLAGVVCPYGHRCHFRHSVTPADLFLPRP